MDYDLDALSMLRYSVRPREQCAIHGRPLPFVCRWECEKLDIPEAGRVRLAKVEPSFGS